MVHDSRLSAQLDRIHVLGPEGTFSDAAARIYVEYLAAEGRPRPVVVHARTIEKALADAAADIASIAIVPIENSETGTVIVTQDQLRSLPLSIEWELSIPVRYSLISTSSLELVSRVFCQPLAHAQCSRFLTEHLTSAEVSFVSSNAQAGVELEALGDAAAAAALVPSEYVKPSRWQVVMVDVQNSEFNTTRFLVTRTRLVSGSIDFSRSKTSP